MFEFFQNQKNNEELIGMAERIENKFETYLEDKEYISWRYHHIGWRYRNVDDENDGPMHNDGPYNDSPEDRFERLPRELDPDDYVRKERYSSRELDVFENIAIWGDTLDHYLRHDDGFTEKYSNQVRVFFQRVAEIANDEESPNHVKEKGSSIRRLILKWLESIAEMMRPLRTLGLFYLDYTVRQTRMLLELYQTGATTAEGTQRHMFEMGLKCLKISDISFLDILFTPNRIINFATRPFYDFFRDLVITQVAVIHWITNARIAKNIREELFDGFPFAESAYRKGPNSGYWETVLNPYKVHYKHYFGDDINGRFHFKDENLNGFLGYRDIDAKRKEIIIGFSGTEICSIKNWRTNIDQFIGLLPLTYAQACGIVDGVWKGSTHKKGFENAIIKIYGHSLGGGLMQYAIANTSAKRIHGYGYNSAGLSFENIKQANSLNKPINIYHLYNPCDLVFILPGSIQLGVAVEFDQMTPEAITAHLVRTIRSKIKKCRKELLR